MGCLSSTPADINNKIANEKYKAVEQIKYKLLLLGAGESGKSTLLKQFRMLHGRQYDQSELLAAKPHLTQNTMEAMRTLAIYSCIFSDPPPLNINRVYLISGYIRKHCYDLYIPQCIEQVLDSVMGEITKYPLDIDTKVNEENEEIRQRVARMSDKQKFTNEHYKDFQKLWNDEGIKKTFEYRHHFQIIDTAPYLFENMDNYWRDDYIPTFKDLTHSLQRTGGVNRIKFMLPDKYGAIEEIYEIYDVGGRKNHRRKWTHFFDNTTAVIFVAALSGYNQLLWEDNRNNRMREAIGLFRGIVNLDVFRDTHFIVFLNKSDLFEQKVGKHAVKKYFRDFEGNETKDEIINFFKQKFKYQRRKKRDGYNYNKPEIHFHVTCATDTSCVKYMFESCRTIIIEKELIYLWSSPML